MRYEFGRNWAQFVEKHLSPQRITIAQQCLLGFLHLPDLKGKTFMDIGCGSGIHSLAAIQAGAQRVISFDYDPDAVAITRTIRASIGSPPEWEVLQGSVLDQNFLSSLGTADVVYSWGVLHHTGDMWAAVRNAASRLAPSGVFYTALYTSDVFTDPKPEYWLRVKRRYNSAGPLTRRVMELKYAWDVTILPELAHGRNPLRYIREYHRSRGMSYWTDVRDWLGGWPMEFAGIAETKAFCSGQLNLELLNMRAGEANTEYLFRKKGARNYWDDVAASGKAEDLLGPFWHRKGYAWSAPLPHLAGIADSVEHPKRSRLMLYENRVPLGFAHAPHAHIEAFGAGRYSHWRDTLIFSTTDNTDPNTNGRHYTICPDML